MRSIIFQALPFLLLQTQSFNDKLYDMKKATVRHVQHHLKDVLRRTKYGEEVVITRNGIPIARLTKMRVTNIEAAKKPQQKFASGELAAFFMNRLKKNFGNQVFPDSQPIFDYMREDRV